MLGEHRIPLPFSADAGACQFNQAELAPQSGLLQALAGMLNIAATLLVAIAAASALPAGACHVVQPITGRIKHYKAIFVGEVTGIRLRGYENLQLGRTDGCTSEGNGVKPLCFNITSDPLVSVFALPRVVVRGKVTDVQEIDQAGCNKPDLTLKERGIFFVNPDGRSAAIVWESQSNYEDWLRELGVDQNAR